VKNKVVQNSVYSALFGFDVHHFMPEESNLSHCPRNSLQPLFT